MSSMIHLTAAVRGPLLGFALLAASTAALPAQTEVVVGGSQIRLPNPTGFHEVSSSSPETRRLAEAMTLPANRLLAILVSEADLGRLMGGNSATYERYMMVQTPRADGPVSHAAFADIATALRARHETAVQTSADRVNPQLDRAESAVSREHNMAVQLQIGEQRSLGIFAESDRSISLAMLSKVRASVEGQDRSYVLAVATSMVRVGDRLLFVYVYSRYASQQDLDWVRATSKDWVASILSAN